MVQTSSPEGNPNAVEEKVVSRRFLGFDLPYLFAEWKAMFNPRTFLADVWAGVTVALVALTLNLALAIAAGVEPGVGITSGIVAGVIAALLGGQRYGVTGPTVAMTVVLIEVAQVYGLSGLWLVSLLAGVLQLLSGWLKLGQLISYIPRPVLVGFTNAIGILVICNALANFVGVGMDVAHANNDPVLDKFVPELLLDVSTIFSSVFVQGEFNVQATIIGSLVLFLAAFVPRLTKTIPSQLIAVVIGSLVAVFLGLQVPKIVDISTISGGVPTPHVPDLPWHQILILLPSAFAIYMLGSIESLLSASVADG
ncbi:MAG: hypothetical protein K2Z81_26290, partial [Cyanobacteria bacterium]|nr:hypothetical protein [Cyanobacteriota bacterium]